jgi:4-hydroxybenzoate polyprenyltransferase
MKVFQKLQKIISNIENYPLSISQFLLGFSAIIALRMLGENLIAGLAGRPLDLFVGSALAAYLFFLFAYLITLIFLRFYLREPARKLANILLWGYLLVIFPPLIDKLWCGRNFCWSFYAFDSLRGLGQRFLTFFGSDATIGITYGVRVEVALAIVFLMIYIFLKTKKALKSLLGGLIAYIILFILGSFPSWLTFIILSPAKKITAVEGFDVAGLFLSPARYFSIESADILNALNVKMNLIYVFLLVPVLLFFFWYNYREKFWPVVRNVRWIQIMIHAGLILFGAGLGAFYFPDNLQINIFALFALANLILAAIFAWLASVFLNDIVDLEIDKQTNKKRPLVTGEVSRNDYNQLFWASFVMSLLLSLAVGVKFFLIVLAYQIIGWVYSCFPFRLKRFPGVATFLSALALTLLFSSGFILLADNQDISQFPQKVFWLLIIAFAVSLPIKDLKDIEGDKKNGIWTIPVVLGETRARFAIGLGIFVSYALSVVWLNAKILFLPAMVLGASSFWILQSKKISPRRVHIWVFGLLFVYVALMTYLVFYPSVKTDLG